MKSMGSLSRNRPPSSEHSNAEHQHADRLNFAHATQSFLPQVANDQVTEFRVSKPEIQNAVIVEENKSKLNRI